MKRLIFGFALAILAIATLFLWYANRALDASKPVTILQPKDVNQHSVSISVRSPFELSSDGDLYLFGRDILLDLDRLKSMLPIKNLDGFVSAIAAEYRSSQSSASVSSILLQFESWQTCLSSAASVAAFPDEKQSIAFVTAFGDLVVLPPYLMIMTSNTGYTDKIVTAVSLNLGVTIWTNSELYWMRRIKEAVPTPFQFAESAAIDGLLVEFVSGKKLHIVLKQDFADKIAEQMPVRPFGIASAAVDRLFSRKIEDTVYLRAEGRLVFLLTGFSRNPTFPERLEILNTLSYP